MSRDNVGGGVMVEAPTEFGLLGPISAAPLSMSGSTNSLGVRIGRRTSKSVSGARPPLSTSASSHRTLGYANPYASEAGPSTGGPSGGSPSLGPTRVRNGLKRRISTPNLIKGRSLVHEEGDGGEPDHGHGHHTLGSTTPNLQTSKVVETRARSTSTSIVVPQTLPTEPESPTFAEPTIVTLPSQPSTALPTPPWSGMYVTPPSPPSMAGARGLEPDPPAQDAATDLLTSTYDMGETVFSRVISWVRPKRQRRSRRRSHASDDDSEKGLNGSEDEEEFDEKDDGENHTRSSRVWSNILPGSRTPDSPSYFALPPTPPDDRQFDHLGYPGSLPTPAISSQSLSHGGPTKRQRRASRAAALKEAQADGWWVKVYRSVSVSGSGKTAQVLRELGWTVALLALLFVVSFLLVLYSIMSMPITHLKSMPKSTTDLQLLSADIRSYMRSSDSGWWHTVGVLTYVGCWKHAWSVPGAVVLNILVGSLFDTIPALGLLTLITASGSLGAYMLSRPLAPLIGVLFPKPLALVRAALAPESVPKPSNVAGVRGETVTPIQVSDDPREPALGAPEDRPNVWARLLTMRAMGFVPWSGMNVACGVVGVDWRVFWLTTAAGSASWSYVTASVGNILGHLALPTQGEDGVEVKGESLTSLLRDPMLIAQMVLLSVLTVVPVLLKRRARSTGEETDSDADSLSDAPTPTSPQPHSVLGLDTGIPSLSINTANLDSGEEYPSEPASPLAISLASFTPTPHMFDLLSFGRTAMRQGVRVVVGTARTAATSTQRIFGRQ